MSKKKVLYARFHAGVYIPGAGDLGSVFPPQTKTLENLDMSIDADGLTIKFLYRGIKTAVLVPSANVVLASLDPNSLDT